MQYQISTNAGCYCCYGGYFLSVILQKLPNFLELSSTHFFWLLSKLSEITLNIPRWSIDYGYFHYFITFSYYLWASLITQSVKKFPIMQKTRLPSLDWEDPLEKGMATHSSIFAWRIPWAEEPGGLQSMGLQRVGLNWATNTHTIFVSLLYIYLDTYA